MATNTRRAARQRDGESGRTDSQDRAEGVGPHSRAASESVTGRSQTTPPPRREDLNDDEEAIEEFEAEEDEFAYYAQLAQDELERQVQRTQLRVSRKRKERELYNLRRELRGLPPTHLRDADETTTSEGRASKRRKLSDGEDAPQLRRSVRPAEPLYYHGKNIKELEEFLVFWVI
jgi:hypothetical protein